MNNMNELEELKKELQEVNNKQIRLQTIVEQAKQQCAEIEKKYNINNEAELKALLDNAEETYKQNLEKATIYLLDAKQALQPYEGLL